MSHWQRTLVTAALPYANGDLHLGHLAGAYLPADIYARTLRLLGREVLFICGTDEYGVPITKTAESLGITPQELVDRNHASIRDSFAALGISFDNFSQTSRPIHTETSQAFFLDLHRQGKLKQKTTDQFFCPACARFLADRYVEGTCPKCGSAGARGDQCEKCGTALNQLELVEPRCATCGAAPETRATQHWFLPLGDWQSRLEAWLAGKPNWRENVLNYCRGWFAQGLDDRAITRDLAWGVPVPLPEHEGKVIYVWFDAPIGYISATREWAAARGEPEAWRTWWQDPGTRLLHFIGKDNIVFHAIMFPAMLMAHSEPYILPDNVPANEFLNLEGNKLSTSRGFAVWLPDYLAKFPADSLRYALARNLPETRDTDFTWDGFQARHNNELGNNFGNLINRVLAFAHKYFDGRVPEWSEAAMTALDRAALDEVGALPRPLRGRRGGVRDPQRGGGALRGRQGGQPLLRRGGAVPHPQGRPAALRPVDGRGVPDHPHAHPDARPDRAVRRREGVGLARHDQRPAPRRLGRRHAPAAGGPRDRPAGDPVPADRGRADRAGDRAAAPADGRLVRPADRSGEPLAQGRPQRLPAETRPPARPSACRRLRPR